MLLICSCTVVGFGWGGGWGSESMARECKYASSRGEPVLEASRGCVDRAREGSFVGYGLGGQEPQ